MSDKIVLVGARYASDIKEAIFLAKQKAQLIEAKTPDECFSAYEQNKEIDLYVIEMIHPDDYCSTINEVIVRDPGDLIEWLKDKGCAVLAHCHHGGNPEMEHYVLSRGALGLIDGTLEEKTQQLSKIFAQ